MTNEPTKIKEPQTATVNYIGGENSKAAARVHTGSAYIEQMERHTEAIRLRKSGMSYDEIGRRLNVAPHVAYEYVVTGLSHFVEEPGEEVRKMEILRLDAMLHAIWAACMSGDLEAIDRALKIEQFRAKITGMLMPIKIDIEVRIRDMARTMGLSEEDAVNTAAEYIRLINAANSRG